MIDRGNVIKGLEICSEHGAWHGCDCELNEAYKDCPYHGCETGCVVTIAKDALALLKEQNEPMNAKNPVYNKQKYGDYLAHCPSCEKALPMISQYGKSNYCYRCGQAVKWND